MQIDTVSWTQALRDAVSSEPSVLHELHASGRLQFISQSAIAWKATTVFEPTFTYAAECVANARKALDAFARAALYIIPSYV